MFAEFFAWIGAHPIATAAIVILVVALIVFFPGAFFELLEAVLIVL